MSTPSLQHFIEIGDLTSEQFWGLLGLARRLKEEWLRTGHNDPVLAGKNLAMVFQKPSLRTRVSFEMGMRHLGGHAAYLSPQEIGLGQRESVPDVARVLSGYVEGLMARVFDHAHVVELARWASVPVINGLSDYNHPCQGLSDIFTLWEHWNWGDLAGKVLAYVGDGSNNVATSLIMAAGKAGMRVVVVSPPNYTPDPAVVTRSGAEVTITADPNAVRGADVLYTDVWVSMGQEAERERRLAVLAPYQVNQALVERTGNPDVVVMHCLPAHRGEEITDQVMDGPHSIVFAQAHNRLHAQKALLAHLLGNVPLE